MHIITDIDRIIIKRFDKKFLFIRAFFKFMDFFLLPLILFKFKKNSNINKILIVNSGHIGDAVITSRLLSSIKKKYPTAQIGMLINSGSKFVFTNNEYVFKIHCLDHWYTNRSNISKWKKIIYYYFFDLYRVAKEINAVSYDVAIDMRMWYPNYSLVIWLSKIPIRIGYVWAGGGPLYSVPLRFKMNRRNEFDYQFDLLNVIGITEYCNSPSISFFNTPFVKLPPEFQYLIASQRLYRIFHLGTSTLKREISLKVWKKVIYYCIENGIIPVVTGKGERDKLLADNLKIQIPEVINLSNLLNWEQLKLLIANAQLIYSVETSIGHLAASLNKPLIAIYGGFSDHQHWSPYGCSVALVRKDISCSPCFNKRSCTEYKCINQITHLDIIIKENDLLNMKPTFQVNIL